MSGGSDVRAVTTALSVADHGVLFGAGFFETFRTRDGVPVRLVEHLSRLRVACARLGIVLPAHFLAANSASDRWASELFRLLEESALRDGVFRLTVTAGINTAAPGSGDYTEPREWLTVRPLPPAPPAEGICLRLLDTTRSSPEWRPRPKSLNYLNSLSAARELASRRAEASEEGVMLDAAGAVCEGVVSNLFWFRDGVWYTPHEDTGCLPGVGRAHALARLRAAGVRVEETILPVEALVRAESVASVGSVRGVVPVRALLAKNGYATARYSLGAAEALRRLFEA